VETAARSFCVETLPRTRKMLSLIFSAAIFHDGGLPIAVRFTQFFDEAAGEAVFRQGGLKLVVVLQFFALLRSL